MWHYTECAKNLNSRRAVMDSLSFTRKGGILTHSSGMYRLRERKGRCLEAEFSSRPGLWISTGTRDVEEASRFAEKKLTEGGILVKSEHARLSDYGDPFFGDGIDCMLREKDKRFNKIYQDDHYKSMESNYRNYIRPKFGNMNPAAITDVMIEDWYTTLVSVRDKTPLASASKCAIYETMKHLMKELKRQKVITANPCDTVETLVSRTENPRKPYTLDEVRRLFPADIDEAIYIWSGLGWALYFSIMADTGWRPAEVMGVRRDGICDAGIYQTHSVDHRTRKVKGTIKTTMSGQPYKVGILSDYTRELLDRYLKEIPDTQEYLFSMDDGIFPVSVPNKILRKAANRAGVPYNERTQYSLRHFFATYIRTRKDGEGLSEVDVEELLAHTSYRPEYDHRTGEMMVFRLSNKARDAINDIRIKEAE